MAQTIPAPFADFHPDPENPGWLVRPPDSQGWFFDLFGLIRMKAESDDRVRIRFYPEDRHRNILEGVHGGFIMAVVDQILFLAPAALEIENSLGGSTVDASVQFIAPLRTGRPMDAVVEILRVTGRMIFMRGLIEQDDVTAAAFSGTIRKASRPR